mmetsp:Transcript_126015/g.402776  ORF Transcript_126015/g.402776 Transcript_126015/m.402776 type:complete len:263 (+) Transcript_126015:560-1348(+)
MLSIACNIVTTFWSKFCAPDKSWFFRHMYTTGRLCKSAPMTRSSPPKANSREINTFLWVWRQTKACLNFSEAFLTFPSLFRNRRLQKASVPYSLAKSLSSPRGWPGSSSAIIWQTPATICGSVWLCLDKQLVSLRKSSSCAAVFCFACLANKTTFATFKATAQETRGFCGEDVVESVTDVSVDALDGAEGLGELEENVLLVFSLLDSNCSSSCGAVLSTSRRLEGEVAPLRASHGARAQHPPTIFENEGMATAWKNKSVEWE